MNGGACCYRTHATRIRGFLDVIESVERERRHSCDPVFDSIAKEALFYLRKAYIYANAMDWNLAGEGGAVDMLMRIRDGEEFYEKTGRLEEEQEEM